MIPTNLARNGVSKGGGRWIQFPVLATKSNGLSSLDDKRCVTESVFGWNRSTVAAGINEVQCGILRINDLSTRPNTNAYSD